MKVLSKFKSQNSYNIELQLLSRLKSPFIVEFIEYFYFDINICIILEYCQVIYFKYFKSFILFTLNNY